MSETRILRCGCQHAYQDAEYGPRKRVHNRGDKAWLCTVCSSPKPLTTKGDARRELLGGER